MFSRLNNLTLMTLVYEYFETRTYKMDEIIITQSKQAPTNVHYKGYYDSRVSKFA